MKDKKKFWQLFLHSLYGYALCFSQAALCGPYNFSDVLMGDRAMGMGGAFAGVADDSSALYYNPAGLGFTSSPNISAAVNAFQTTHRDYKNVFAGKDSFYEDSQDVIPSFTGGVIDLKKLSDGTHGAFTLQNLTQQSSNQNDFVRRPDINVDYLHRAEKSQLGELVFNAGIGKRVAANTALGVSIGGRQLTFDRQQFQDVTTKVSLKNVKLADAVGANKTLFLGRSRNTRLSANAISIELGSGLLWAPVPWLSIGGSVFSDVVLKQGLTSESDEIAIYHYNDLSLPGAADFEPLPTADKDKAQKEIDSLSNKTLQRTTSNNEASAITTKTPPQKVKIEDKMSIGRNRFRLGVAVFPSPQLLLTFDAVGHHTTTEWILSSDTATELVVNFHQGLEYFFSPRFFLRQGLFTNFDARPKDLSILRYTERVDFAGASLFFGTQTADSQFSLGGIFQYGWGEALKLEGQTKPTPVRDRKLLLAFTASHGL